MSTSKEIVDPPTPDQQPVRAAEREHQRVRSTPVHKRRVPFPFDELYVDLGGNG